MMTWARSLGRWTDRINLGLVLIRTPLVRSGEWKFESEIRQMMRDALLPEPDPIDLSAFLYSLSQSWLILLFPSLLVMLAASVIGGEVDGQTGRLIGVAIGVFVPVGSFVGGADAAWRWRVAEAACSRYMAAGRMSDATVRRLIRIARMNTGTLLLQIAIAAIATYLAWP
jgi:hypothetical protein